MAACPGAQIKIKSTIEISDLAGARYAAILLRVQRRGGCRVRCPRRRLRLYAAIVMIGCWPWSLAASVFSEILDRERGRHCRTPGESGILTGSKPEDRERKAVFGCCRRTRPRGDVVSVAGRRPSCGQEPVRSGTQQPERGRLTSAPIPVTVHSAATGISSICSCRITPDSGSNSPTHGACSRAALVCE